MINLFLTLIIGSAGGLIGQKLRLPSGALLGSMIAVGIYNCLGFQSYMPAQVRIGTQIAIGCLLGLSLNRETFKQLKTVIKPVLIIVPSLILFGLTAGFVLFRFFNLDVFTAFLSSMPGGMTELSLLAASLGGDGPRVALLHMIRMISVVSITPVILQIIKKYRQKNKKEPGI